MRYFFLAIALSSTVWTMGQSDFATGLIFDSSDFDKLPQKADYRTTNGDLPANSSLKAYSLLPLKQVGQTCMGHAFTNAYGIHANRARNLTQHSAKETLRYSPYYVYELAKEPTVKKCKSGVRFPNVVHALQNYGIVLSKQYIGGCDEKIPSLILAQGKQHRPTDLPSLFKNNVTIEQKVQAVKRALLEQKPIVGGWEIDDNLKMAKDIWKLSSNIIDRHAMLIVGYDDMKYGGAFEVQNSWGTDWGNGGFIWVRYTDFETRCLIAVEVPPLDETIPSDQILQHPKPIELKISLRNEQNQIIPIEKMTAPVQNGIGKRLKIQNSHFVVTRPMYSKDGYQVWLDIAEPTFVYVLGTDATNQVTTLFPDSTQSALLARGQDFKLPTAEHVFELDNTVGLDYMCILLSKEALNIQKIRQSIEKNNQNSFLTAIETTLGEKLINTQDKQFVIDKDKLKVTAQYKQTVLPMIIQLEHKQRK